MNIIKKFFRDNNVLYYPGCLTKFALKDIQKKYEILLKKEGIDFIVLKDEELCCGSPVKNAGKPEEFEKLAQKNLKLFKEHGIGKIITNCPACAIVFKKDYAEILGDKWDVEVKHMTEVITPKKEVYNEKSKKVTYHDPCHLGREMGIYDQPRKIICSQGLELKEMELCRNKSYCCGGGGGVKSNFSDLANSIAKDRIRQAKKTEAEILITPCPMCFANLKENSGDLEVKELSEILEKESGV
jgi:heterodisulfide reductase subunit D